MTDRRLVPTHVHDALDLVDAIFVAFVALNHNREDVFLRAAVPGVVERGATSGLGENYAECVDGIEASHGLNGDRDDRLHLSSAERELTALTFEVPALDRGIALESVLDRDVATTTAHSANFDRRLLITHLRRVQSQVIRLEAQHSGVIIVDDRDLTLADLAQVGPEVLLLADHFRPREHHEEVLAVLVARVVDELHLDRRSGRQRLELEPAVHGLEVLPCFGSRALGLKPHPGRIGQITRTHDLQANFPRVLEHDIKAGREGDHAHTLHLFLVGRHDL
mmetsp:Transcript_4908/g.14742  ORF Transcript_4908/g.14742 Transcript_4908/m.14742 type:complete len:279 (+) Transcript_4908:856-1692(+)